MQSYLYDYPGSRSNPEYKFIRAVNSFLEQTYIDSELVIVSDGCDITKRLYNENFYKNSRIKFFYIEKSESHMYKSDNNSIYYRGFPRQIGRLNSTGEIVTYMDSDDFIIPEYLENLMYYWNNNSSLDWIINKMWYDNIYIKENPTLGYYDIWETHETVIPINIEGLDSLWLSSKVKNGVVMSPALLSHKNNCLVQWNDVLSNGTISEDSDFNKKLREMYPTTGALIEYPGYVRCHLKDRWDL